MLKYDKLLGKMKRMYELEDKIDANLGWVPEEDIEEYKELKKEIRELVLGKYDVTDLRDKVDEGIVDKYIKTDIKVINVDLDEKGFPIVELVDENAYYIGERYVTEMYELNLMRVGYRVKYRLTYMIPAGEWALIKKEELERERMTKL